MESYDESERSYKAPYRSEHVDPYKHKSHQHAASAPVYSPECDYCLDMFEAMWKALNARGWKEQPKQEKLYDEEAQ